MLCPYDVRQFPFAILGLRKIEKKGQEKKKRRKKRPETLPLNVAKGFPREKILRVLALRGNADE
jgi:hypothetical protein